MKSWSYSRENSKKRKYLLEYCQIDRQLNHSLRRTKKKQQKKRSLELLAKD